MTDTLTARWTRNPDGSWSPERTPASSSGGGVGPAGPAGPAGATGATGATGPTGPSGAAPLTTKGDLLGYDTVANRVPVGADGQVLTADSTSTPGVKWATAPGGSSFYQTSIPRMTSATAPSGTASDSEHYGSAPAWNAMAAIGTYNGWLSNGSALPQWIQYQYASAKTAIAYGFRPWFADNYPSRTPTAWTFQGSNDGTTWTTLDSVSGWSPTSSSLDFVWAIASPASYAYYRLNITANGGNAYVGVGEFLIMTSEDPSSGTWVVSNNGTIMFAN